MGLVSGSDFYNCSNIYISIDIVMDDNRLSLKNETVLLGCSSLSGERARIKEPIINGYLPDRLGRQHWSSLALLGK